MVLGLCFTVYGSAYCGWTERKNETIIIGIKTNVIQFERRDVYINTRTYLFGSDNAMPIEVPSGTHRYEFSYQLPRLLPPSLCVNRGLIRYNIEAILDVPWNYDKEFKLSFIVIRPDDLIALLKQPTEHKEIRKIYSFFQQSQPLLMSVKLPLTGYSPGQLIHVTIDYNNKSNVEVLKTQINLIRSIRYTR